MCIFIGEVSRDYSGNFQGTFREPSVKKKRKKLSEADDPRVDVRW
jgi:hypothetical protein